jgi:hypothetical protein
MNIMFYQKKYFVLILLILAQIFLSCQNKNGQPYIHELKSIENRYFVLDFQKNTYEMSDIKDHFFTTFPHDDPTQGDVIYDRLKWINKDMLKLEGGDGLYLYIKSRDDDTNFDSFRLTSKAFYNLHEDNHQLLFVYKGKFPSVNAVWPAWWLNGSKQDEWTYKKAGRILNDEDLDKYSGKGHFYDTPTAVNPTDWPAAGEIDIIETINGNNIVHNTIHTCPQMCDSEWNSDGIIINCANAKEGDPNAGCSGKPYKLSSVEGTFACLWERNALKFFYWTPEEDVRETGGPLNQKPDPDRWGGENLKNEVRLLETDSECDSNIHENWQCNSCATSTSCVFSNMKMIFNITLCGKWAGNQFDESEQALQNCQSYIAGEGREKISNQYIKIEYVSVRKI